MTSPRTDSLDYRTELLSPAATADHKVNVTTSEPSWRLDMDKYQLPENRKDSHFGFGYFLKTLSKIQSFPVSISFADYFHRLSILQGCNYIWSSVANNHSSFSIPIPFVHRLELLKFHFFFHRKAKEDFRVLQETGKAAKGIQ